MGCEHGQRDQRLPRAGLQVQAGATLTQLAAVAPEPWASILREHRDALRRLSAQVEQAIAQCHLLLESGSQAAEQTPAEITETLAAYDDPDAAHGAGADPASEFACRPGDDPHVDATEHLIRTRSEQLAPTNARCALPRRFASDPCSTS